MHSADVINNHIYVFGGGTLEKAFDDFYKLDAINRHWVKIDALGETPDKRVGHGSCTLGENLCIFGGRTRPEHVFYNDFFIYTT